MDVHPYDIVCHDTTRHDNFSKKWFVDYFMTCYLNFYFNIFNWIFVDYNNIFEFIIDQASKACFHLQHLNKFWKKKMLNFEFPKKFHAKNNKVKFFLLS
jgi:hypothetical protein